MIYIQTHNITVWRGNNCIVTKFNLTIYSGQAVLLNGDNGSGKTTLLQAIANLIKVQKGVITRNCSYIYLGHKDGINLYLTPYENIYYAARIYHNMKDDNLDEKIMNALECVGLNKKHNIQCRYLSAGQKKRCQLARLWLTIPPLLILDEPFTSLDTTMNYNLITRLENHIKENGSLLFSSHHNKILPKINLTTITLPCNV